MLQKKHKTGQIASLRPSGGTRVTLRLPTHHVVSGAGLWTRGPHPRGQRDGRRSGRLQEQHWHGERGRLTGGGSLGRGAALRGRARGLALALLEDVQAFSQTAEGGSRRGFEEQQVLVQAGERPPAGQGVDGMHQVLLLALCLGHDLGTTKPNLEPSGPRSDRIQALT